MSAVEMVPRTGRTSRIRIRPVPPCDPPFDDELSADIWAPLPNQLALEWPDPPAEGVTDAGRDAVGRLTASPLPMGDEAESTPAATVTLTTGTGRSTPRHDTTARSAAQATVRHGTAAASAIEGSAAHTTTSNPAADRVTAGDVTGRSRGRRNDRARPAGSGPMTGTPGPVPGVAAGDAKLAVRRFVHLCVEVLNGHRPAAQLRRLSLPMDAPSVVAQAVAGARRVAEVRRAAARPGDRRARRPGPVAVLRLRLCEPRPGAVEAAVLLVTGDRTWAMALRLELHQQAWAATVLRLI